MLKHVTLFGAATLAFSLSTATFAQDAVTAETVVATVGETEITVGHIIIARRQLPAQYSQFPNEALFDGLVDQLIQQQLLTDTLEDVPAHIEYTLKNERRSLIAAEAISSVVDDIVTPEAIQAAYDERFAEVAEIQEFQASHLLVETEEEAIAAKNRIDAGSDFANVARDVSTGPTGPNGGDLGWFGSGAMVPEFENAITALEIGGVSDPFKTQFGWHVATLVDTRVQENPTLEETSNQIASELREAAITAHLEELAEVAIVVKPEVGTFDPNIIDQYELLE